MSIYRSQPKRPADGGDVRRPVTRDETASPAARRMVAAPADRDWAPLRKSSPANYMLPPSLKWFAGLPLDLRPMALVTKYPRIANLLALQWTKPSACRGYFEDLLTDRRGGRQGFPADVLRDLVALRHHYYHQHLTLED